MGHQQLGAGDGAYAKAEATILVDLADTVQPRAYMPVIMTLGNRVVTQ